MNLLKTNYKSENVISIFQTFTNFNKTKKLCKSKISKITQKWFQVIIT